MPPNNGNRLLEALPPPVLSDMARHFHTIDMVRNQLIHGSDEELHEVIFIDSGMVSLMMDLGQSGAAEVGTIGREGLMGIAALLQTRTREKATVQISGEARAIRAASLHALMERHGALRDVLYGYISRRLLQTEIGMACNALHTVQQRVARWLMMAYMRQGAEFTLKQDYLAEMLGVRRASISGVANAMQATGLIRYRRGALQVVDPARLEAMSCGCDRRIMQAHERGLERAVAAAE